MTSGRHAVLAAAAALLLPAAAAAAPAISPSILQCDGSYAPGGATRTPNPTIQVSISDPAGLRLSAYPLGIFPSQTRELWRFDATFSAAAVQCNDTNSYSCGFGQTCYDYTLTYAYTYSDPNTSDTMEVGRCVYSYVGAYTATNNCLLSPKDSGGATITPTLSVNSPPPGGSCPATPPPAGGTFSFPASTLSASFGNVLPLNGSSQYGRVPYNAAAFDLGPSYSLSAWIKTTVSGTQRVVSEQGAGYWGFGLSGNGVRHFDSRNYSSPLVTNCGNFNTDCTIPAPAGLNLLDGAWHMIAVARVNGQSTSYYADGRLIGTVVAQSSISFAGNGIKTPAYLGSYQGTSEFFNGQLDDVRVADYTPSADDVMLEYMGTMHKYSTNGGVGFSTAATGSYVGSPTNGATSVTFIPPEAVNTGNMATSRWIFAAQDLNSVSSLSPIYSVAIDNSPPIAPTPSATATTPFDLTWSWGTPPRFCAPPGSPSVTFQLFDAATNAALPGTATYPTSQIGENVGATPNQPRGRRLRVADVWGASALSASATAYTLAQLPSSLSLASLSTGSVVVSWSANGNPGYTRYELTYSPDNFAQTVSTRVGAADNWTATSVGLAGLATGTTYYARLRAFNGQAADFYGGVPTTYYVSASFVTTPAAPQLSAAPLGVSSITWTWTSVPGSAGYTLYDSPTQTPLTPVGAPLLSWTTTNLAINARYDAEVEADSPPPPTTSARSHAFTYTNANPPSAPYVSGIFSTSATFTWGANGNPAYTIYQVSVATDPTFGVVVATLSVAGATTTASNLLPGATYYARVAAVSGAQVFTAFVPLPQTATAADPAITVAPSPATPYILAPGLVGSWQFDEAAGTTTADLSGQGNPVSFWCLTAGCVSTPTFAAGPPGLGTSASFPGLAGSVALSNSGAPFGFTDSLTVEAWANPQTAAQTDGAGLVARGWQGAEDFALDVHGGAFRFLATPASAATVSTATIAAGQWTHVAGVYDASVGSATLYLNGRPAAVVLGVPARSNSGQALAIGDRADPGGNFTRGFLGRVDSVRVFHRALSASDVAAEYQSAFVSTVAAPAPNTGILVALPPNAFGSPAQFYFSADPLNHPIRIPPSVLAAGLASPPPGLTLVPSSIVEIVPIVGGLPFALPLGSSATVSLPYRDANGDNIIDGSSPPLAASLMTMYTLNTTVNRWEALPTTIDPVNRRATAVTPHFSVFALFAPTTIAAGLSSVRVYPVPWEPGTGGRFDGPGVTFDDLPASGSIRVLTSAGQRVREFAFSGASAGKAVWDGLNDDGRRAASGVYFARIKADSGGTILLKFAVER